MAKNVLSGRRHASIRQQQPMRRLTRSCKQFSGSRAKALTAACSDKTLFIFGLGFVARELARALHVERPNTWCARVPPSSPYLPVHRSFCMNIERSVECGRNIYGTSLERYDQVELEHSAVRNTFLFGPDHPLRSVLSALQ